VADVALIEVLGEDRDRAGLATFASRTRTASREDEEEEEGAGLSHGVLIGTKEGMD
jgi:hypothetical protein